MAKSYIIGLLLAGLLLLGCTTTQQDGFLTGNVTIGPLCPVEPCHLTEEQVAQAYLSRNVTVYAADMATLVIQKPLNRDGTYMLGLAPGKYFVTVMPAGIRQYTPQEVDISANRTSRLDFNIDTGIR